MHKRSEPLLGGISYFIFSSIAAYPFMSVPSVYHIDPAIYLGILLGAIVICACCMIWLFFNGPRNNKSLFFIGLSLILAASGLYVFSGIFIANIADALSDPQITQLDKVGFKRALAFYQMLQNIIGFGLAALGANLSATAITNKHADKLSIN